MNQSVWALLLLSALSGVACNSAEPAPEAPKHNADPLTLASNLKPGPTLTTVTLEISGMT